MSIFGGTYLIFRSTRIQTIAAQWFTSQLSLTFKTRISVGGVDISLFKNIVLEKVIIEDRNQDTLCYLGNLKFRIDSLDLLKKKVHLGDLYFEDSRIRVSKESKGYNYQFLTESGNSKSDSIKPWQITFKNLFFRDGNIRYKDLTARDTLVNGINFNDLEVKKFKLKIFKF